MDTFKDNVTEHSLFFPMSLCMQGSTNDYRIRYRLQISSRLKALCALLTLSTCGCLFLWLSLMAIESPRVSTVTSVRKSPMCDLEIGHRDNQALILISCCVLSCPLLQNRYL